MRAHFGAGGELDILRATERTDADAVAEHRRTFEHHVDVDLDIGPTITCRGCRRAPVGETRAVDAQFADRAQLECALQLRELPSIVRAFGFLRILDDHDLGRGEFVRGRRRTCR